MKTIETLGPNFTRRHEWLLATAKACEVALCGGCAAAISKDRADYVPADLDLVTTKANALRFVDAINHFLLEKNVHYRIYVNCHNDFVPSPATAHFRIQCPFWVPVCLFVLLNDKFRFYRIQGGHLLQLPQDVKQAADALTERDEKPRLANELAEEFEANTEEIDLSLEDFEDPTFIADRMPPDFLPDFDSMPYTKPL